MGRDDIGWTCREDERIQNFGKKKISEVLKHLHN
jgi:hypothetical protein